MLQIGIMMVFCLIIMIGLPVVAVMMYPMYKKYGNDKRSLKEFLRCIF